MYALFTLAASIYMEFYMLLTSTIPQPTLEYPYLMFYMFILSKLNYYAFIALTGIYIIRYSVDKDTRLYPHD